MLYLSSSHFITGVFHELRIIELNLGKGYSVFIVFETVTVVVVIVEIIIRKHVVLHVFELFIFVFMPSRTPQMVMTESAAAA